MGFYTLLAKFLHWKLCTACVIKTCGRKRERETDSDWERDRQGERERQREREGETERQIDRQTETVFLRSLLRETETERDRVSK